LAGNFKNNRHFQNLKTLFRLLGVYTKMDLMWFLRDTRYCLLQIAADTISAAAAVSGVFLLSVQFGGIGGMNENEILFMLSYATMVDGVFMIFFAGSNTGSISRVIGRGQLDHAVIQPVPIWIQLITGGFSPVSGSSMLVCGIALSIYSIQRLHLNVSIMWIAAYLFSVICSTVIIVSVTYIVSCLAFYAPAAAEEISEVARDLFTSLKSYPLGGTSWLWQTVFCTIIPVGLAAWFPSSILLSQRPNGVFGGVRFPALTSAVAAVLLIAATLLFKKGMNYYAKNGSPRYSGFGHR